MGYPMEKPPKSIFGSFVGYTRCNAKTRGGGLCQNLPMGNGRCRMHGGASLRGPEHPRYKDGKYSKYKPVDMADLEKLIAEYAAMPDPFVGVEWPDLPPLEPFDLVLE